MSDGTCSVEGCGKPVFVKSRQLCQTCYWRWWRNGDPTVLKKSQPRRGATVEERFWPEVNKNGPVPDYAPHLGPCWIWTGKLNEQGYGSFNIGRKHPGAHVVSYELLVQKVPVGLELDHLCRVTACVNPDHLDPVTHAENMRRRLEAQTHCINDHLFDEANTRWYRGHRRCRACDREAARAKRQAKVRPPVTEKRRTSVTVKLSEDDALLVDAACAGRQRAVWVREVGLAAAAQGMIAAPGRPAWGSVRCEVVIHAYLTEDEAARIDTARGKTPRGTWMRAAALAAAA